MFTGRSLIRPCKKHTSSQNFHVPFSASNKNRHCLRIDYKSVRMCNHHSSTSSMLSNPTFNGGTHYIVITGECSIISLYNRGECCLYVLLLSFTTTFISFKTISLYIHVHVNASSKHLLVCQKKDVENDQ